MEIFMQYVRIFICGGLFCVVAQVMIDKTKITPARILVGYVVAGVILTAIGLYEPLVNFARSGATVPLTGFGYVLAKGVQKSVSEKGMIGAFTGGLTAASAGLAMAVMLGSVCALIFRSRAK